MQVSSNTPNSSSISANTASNEPSSAQLGDSKSQPVAMFRRDKAAPRAGLPGSKLEGLSSPSAASKAGKSSFAEIMADRRGQPPKEERLKKDLLMGDEGTNSKSLSTLGQQWSVNTDEALAFTDSIRILEPVARSAVSSIQSQEQAKSYFRSLERLATNHQFAASLGLWHPKLGEIALDIQVARGGQLEIESRDAGTASFIDEIKQRLGQK